MSGHVLDRRITIQRRDTGCDAIGQPVDTWTDVCTVWANKGQPKGLERIRASADVSTLRVSWCIRWRAGIDAGMRIVHGGQVWDIKGPPTGDRRDGWLYIVAEAMNASS